MISDDNLKIRIQSPLGLIEIRTTTAFVTSIKFINDATIPNSPSEVKDLPTIIHHCIDELQDYFDGNLQKFSFPHQ